MKFISYSEALSKEHFGNETFFTSNYLSKEDDGRKSLNDLLKKCGFDWDLSNPRFEIVPNKVCVDKSKPDIAIYFDGKSLIAIEAQDAKGKADRGHVAKIPVYTSMLGINQAILICDDIAKEYKDLIDKKFTDNIWVVRPSFLYIEPNKYMIDWAILHSPESFSNKVNRIEIEDIKNDENNLNASKKWWKDIVINKEPVNRFFYTRHNSSFETFDDWKKAGFPGEWSLNTGERDSFLYELQPNIFAKLIDMKAYTETTLHELMQTREPGTPKMQKRENVDIDMLCESTGDKNRCKTGNGRTKHWIIPIPGHEDYIDNTNPGKDDLIRVFNYINDDLQKRNIRDKNGKLIQISGY